MKSKALSVEGKVKRQVSTEDGQKGKVWRMTLITGE